MKHLARFASLACLIMAGAFNLQARDLLYFVDLNAFYDAEGKPYIELSLDIDAASIGYQRTEAGQFQGSIEIRYEITPKDQAEQVYSRAFDLLSPTLTDTNAAATGFGIMDVRRVSLAPGEYILVGYLRDKQGADPRQHKFEKSFFVEAQPTEKTIASDIAFVQSVTPTKTTQAHSKHGFDVTPYVNNGNFIDVDSLRFYMEVYHPGRQTQAVYFANAYITQANSTVKMRAYQRTLRQSVKPLDIVSSGFDISALPTGTYYLNVDFYSQSQDTMLRTSKKFYVISGKPVAEGTVSEAAYADQFNLSEEDLDYYIHTLYYISTPTELDFANSLTTLAEKQNYFYNFWEKRKEKPTDLPSKPWLIYKSRVDYANQHYKAAHLQGWRTELGRVLIVYGTPNDIELFPSSNTQHPHQIWRYNKLKTQANVRFVFYNPNEATNEQVLLHSDLRGERNNPRYEFDLSRTTLDGNLDVDRMDGTKSTTR